MLQTVTITRFTGSRTNKPMNDCQKIVNRIFICLVIVVLAIFLTGCHTFKFQWFPDNDSTDPWKKNPKAVNILKVEAK